MRAPMTLDRHLPSFNHPGSGVEMVALIYETLAPVPAPARA